MSDLSAGISGYQGLDVDTAKTVTCVITMRGIAKCVANARLDIGGYAMVAGESR